MNINKVKEDMQVYLNKRVMVKLNIGRNKKEIYEGIITQIYDRLFILKDKEKEHSFLYADLLTKKLSIKLLHLKK